MALPQLDFTQLTTQADCAAAAAKESAGRGVTALKNKLDGLTSGPDGIFAAGGSLLTSIKNEVNSVINNAKNALGDLEANVISLRAELMAAMLVWQTQGEEAAQRAFDSIKQKFPSFNQDAFIADLQKPGFSFCKDVKDQTISDGNTTPKNIPDAVPPAMTDATMTVTAGNIPSVSSTAIPSRPPSEKDKQELAKVVTQAALYSDGE